MFNFVKILWIGQFAGKRQDIIIAIITLNITDEYIGAESGKNQNLPSKPNAYKNAQKMQTNIENQNVKEKEPAVKDRKMKPNDKD